MPDLQKSETYAPHPRNTAGHAEKAVNRNADNAIIRHDDTTENPLGHPRQQSAAISESSRENQ